MVRPIPATPKFVISARRVRRCRRPVDKSTKDPVRFVMTRTYNRQPLRFHRVSAGTEWIRSLGHEMTLTPPSDRRPPDASVIEFLRDHHGVQPADLEVLGGGFWSAAYGYRVGDEELVLRIGDIPDGFRTTNSPCATARRAAGAEVFTIGEAFGRWFAISRRHHGRFLEEVGPDEADALGPTVVDLLAGLRAVPDTGVVVPPWHEWLLDALNDRPDHHTAGWRARLAGYPSVEQTFVPPSAASAHYLTLVPIAANWFTPICSISMSSSRQRPTPSPRSSRGSAQRGATPSTTSRGAPSGDGGTTASPRSISGERGCADTLGVRGRRHRHPAPRYELHIGATHLGWYATLGDDQNLTWTSRQLDEILERGPLR